MSSSKRPRDKILEIMESSKPPLDKCKDFLAAAMELNRRANYLLSMGEICIKRAKAEQEKAQNQETLKKDCLTH